MRITANTPLDELWALRREFAPRWSSEAAKVRRARRELKGAELNAAKRSYEDFETVATSVIAITDLRDEYEKAMEKSTIEIADLREEIADLRRDSGEVDTPDAPAPTDEAQLRYGRERAAALDQLTACAKAIDSVPQSDAIHTLEHAYADASIRASWASSEMRFGQPGGLTKLNADVFARDKNAIWDALKAMRAEEPGRARAAIKARLGTAIS